MLTRIAERNGRKTLTTVQGLPKKFDQKKILKVIKKKFACNGTVVTDTEMGEVIQLQGDQRKDVQEFLVDKKEGLGLDTKDIKVGHVLSRRRRIDDTNPVTRSTVSSRHPHRGRARFWPMDAGFLQMLQACRADDVLLLDASGRARG